MADSYQGLENYWVETISRDLEGFADPGSDILVDVAGSNITAVWVQRGRDQSVSFRLSKDGDFRWIPESGAPPRTYHEFLCSEGLADFDQLAGSIALAFKPAKYYVETRAAVDRDGKTDYSSSHDVLLATSGLALNDPLGKTQLLFLKGDAGSGKTTLLRELTRKQAELYRARKTPFLFLYISAQGRALSNLRDAISGELDDLRAGFTRDAVPSLVRQCVIVPIIDGFDELLGAAGYGDAFGSLHQFLEQLQGRGVLVVSARSSFYDIEFVGRELVDEAHSSAYDVVPVTLRPWGDDEITQYLALVRGRESVSEADSEAIAELQPRDRDLLAKPFFASLFPGYVDSPEGKKKGVSLVEFLVNSYVRRESGKIVDRDGRPLLSIDGHRQIFMLTAEFMWTGEKRDFSADDLRTVAEMVAEAQGLSGDSAKQLITKITSYAGFRISRHGREQRFQFEHDVYFDHFLSEALRARMGDGGDLFLFMNGGLFPEEVIGAVVDASNARDWLDLVEGCCRPGVLYDNLRRNAGTLTAACFRLGGRIENRIVSFRQFVNTSFGEAVFDSVEFKSCRFVGVHLERTHFLQSRAVDCTAESLVISRFMKMELAGLAPGQNLYCIIDAATGQEIYSPNEMRQVLNTIGVPGMEEAQPEVKYSRQAESLIDLLQKVARRYRQSNLLCLEDDQLGRLFKDPMWPTLHKLLVQHHIVEEELRQTSGARKTFLRYRVLLPDLMLLEREPTLPPGPRGDFWRAVRAL